MRGVTRMAGKEGFTLLETVMALAITAIMSVFLSGFLHPQMKLYYEFERISQARGMCYEAYVEIERALRYGLIYYCDSERPEELSYYERAANVPVKAFSREEGLCEYAPSVERWPRLTADDLDVVEMSGMHIELDFSGTQDSQVCVAIRVMSGETLVYEQDAVIGSMYSYGPQGE